MKSFWKTWIILVVILLVVLFNFVGLFIDYVIFGLVGCVAFAFFQYRYVRQEELLHVLQTAAQANAPLAPTVWAYVSDRPQSTWREFIVSIMLFPIYYWSWHRWYSFDRKVEQLALILEGGAPLHLALRAVPGVASRETVLAAAIGQASGQMAPCLGQVPRWQLATLWLEVIPRLAYPVVILLTANVIFLFQMIFIVPKMEKIFADFKIKLPWLSQLIINGGRWLMKYEWIVGLGILALIALIIVLVFSSTVCWHFPILGRLYRMHAQARVLKALAILLETGKPVPEALQLLLNAGYFPHAVSGRLRRVLDGVEQGEPLPDLLYQNRLLPSSMVPLLHAAGRANNLPWALAELGESHAQRMFRLARRLTMAIFPISVMAVGLAIAFFAVGMFLPLVQLISELPV